MDTDELEELKDQLQSYEHDMLRFLMAEGVDMQSLAQQIADPLNHLDAQLQAISAKTGIPKRVLVGSERGELASTQDITQWRSLIKQRRDWFCEPKILRPFITRCMDHGILPKVEDYSIEWEDLFAPSEKEKAEVGEVRAKALKEYSTNPLAEETLPPELAYKYLFGFSDDQIEEILQYKETQEEEEAAEGREFEGQQQQIEQEEEA